jgi:hypothetical protein
MSKIPFPPVGCGRDSLELGHQHTNEPSCKNKKYFVTWGSPAFDFKYLITWHWQTRTGAQSSCT